MRGGVACAGSPLPRRGVVMTGPPLLLLCGDTVTEGDSRWSEVSVQHEVVGDHVYWLDSQ